MKLQDFLVESWKTYKVSSSPKVLLYDFYLLSYISSLILDPGTRKDVGLTGVGYSGKFFGREGKELDEDIQYAQKQLLPYLGTKLAQALFIAVCAELRHVQDKNQQWSEFKHTKNKTFRNYIINYTLMANKELEAFHLTRDLERPELPTNQGGYTTSFKAAKKAIKDTNGNVIDFANMAADAFTDLKWAQSYGGAPWAGIARGYIQLRKALNNYNPQAPSPSSVSAENLIAAIDHAFDLEHNTGTVLNKVAYFNVEGEGYDWIKKALDLKRDANMYDIAKKASTDMRKLGQEVLKVAGMQDKQMKQVPAEAGIPKKVVKLQGFGKKQEPTKAAFLIGDEVEVKNVNDVKGVVISFTQTPNGILYSVKVTSSFDDLYYDGHVYDLYGEKLTKVAGNEPDEKSSVDEIKGTLKMGTDIDFPDKLPIGGLILDKIGYALFVAQIVQVDGPEKVVKVKVIAVKNQNYKYLFGKTYSHSFGNIKEYFELIKKEYENTFLGYFIVDPSYKSGEETSEFKTGDYIIRKDGLNGGIVLRVHHSGNTLTYKVLAANFKGDGLGDNLFAYNHSVTKSSKEFLKKVFKLNKFRDKEVGDKTEVQNYIDSLTTKAKADEPVPRDDDDIDDDKL